MADEEARGLKIIIKILYETDHLIAMSTRSHYGHDSMGFRKIDESPEDMEDDKKDGEDSHNQA